MQPILAFSLPGGPEWLLIILFVIIFFGAKKIPELARGLGKGIREFKDATKEVKEEIEEGEKAVKEK
ncbi:twin-arginine translocase TatA/TatE family subunit [Fulvivirgaceae bacterium BMA10]|uniref:Sec-independent protein translocase protein TatA n=1 Tax=Splendidivirga corallicola TaxID=3051826 RepID=A0ABT8KS25_9BACT|nr:twin-arginine translocase TatA/TatE family subunit [Fulvivirgaceae bacterium BMA10]